MSLAKLLGIEQEPKKYNARSSKDRKEIERLIVQEIIKYLDSTYTRKGLKEEFKSYDFQLSLLKSPYGFFLEHINAFTIYGQIKKHYNVNGFRRFEQIYEKIFWKQSILDTLFNLYKKHE